MQIFSERLQFFRKERMKLLSQTFIRMKRSSNLSRIENEFGNSRPVKL